MALCSPRSEDERVWDSSVRITLNVRAKRSPRCSLDAMASDSACHRPPHKQQTPCCHLMSLSPATNNRTDGWTDGLKPNLPAVYNSIRGGPYYQVIEIEGLNYQ